MASSHITGSPLSSTSDQHEVATVEGTTSSTNLSDSQNFDFSKEVEDQGPTTEKELWGWFSYAWAAEPFIVSAVGTYVPILLEQFARDNAVRADDHNVACGAPIPGNKHNSHSGDQSSGKTPDHGGHGGLVPPGDINDPSKNHKCVVPIFGDYYIDTSSLALYTFSLSVLTQTLVVISMSGAADRSKFRKKLLVWFATIGAIATCMFIFVTQSHYLICSILAIISNSCFGAVSVCGNSYLPVLVRNHPVLLEAYEEARRLLGYNSSEEDTINTDSEVENNPDETSSLANDSRIVQETQELLERHLSPQETLDNHPLVLSTASKLSGSLSGNGVALGYGSALLVQIITIAIIKLTGSSTQSLKYAIFFVGMWWLVFQIPVSTLLRSRPGPPLPRSSHHSNHRKTLGNRVRKFLMTATNGSYAYVVYGWKTLFVAFKEAREMRDVAIFLISWFMISDAATTINSAAVLFAKTELQMSAPSLAIIGVMVVIFGISGATLMPKYIMPRLGASNPVRGIIFVVLIASLIPAYGIIGFYTKHLGLRNPWEMYVLAAWYGFALGGLNTLCRSIFSLLIPKGKETTFFSLYSVTDKGSSIFGPFITGLITDKTHNIRYTFYFLFFLMLCPALVLSFLDVERGRKEARFLESVEAEADDED